MAGGIVQIVQRLIPGGIETLALELTTRLPGDNRLLSLEWSNAEIIGNWPALAHSACPFEGLEKPPGLRPDFIFSLARRLKALKPRAVMAHHIGPLLYGGLAARLAGIPTFIYVEHDVWHYEDAGHHRLARLAARLARPTVVAVSQNVADAVHEVMPSAPVRVIRNAVDTDRFVPMDRSEARQQMGLPLDGQIVGAAGRLEHVKGQDVLIAAMAEVPDALLVLVGGGSQAEALTAQAQALGIADRVRFLGHRSDMPQIYPALDLVCLPSRNEGLPLSVLEAQACNIPVVATDVGSVSEGIDMTCGALVPPEDPPAMASAIRAALVAPGIPAPRNFVLSRYSWPSMVASYEALTGATP